MKSMRVPLPPPTTTTTEPTATRRAYLLLRFHLHLFRELALLPCVLPKSGSRPAACVARTGWGVVLISRRPRALQAVARSFLELQDTEFCHILNATVRTDDADLCDETAVVSRGINTLCVTAGREGGQAARHPPDNVCYRGSGFDDAYRSFFVVGRSFRQPAYLATSFTQAKADFFLQRSPLPSKVRWLVRIDPVRKCVHVNLVRKRVPNLPDEQEYLFAPYSAFTVTSVTWTEGTVQDPHVIELLAAVDNKEEPEDLPLAPWS